MMPCMIQMRLRISPSSLVAPLLVVAIVQAAQAQYIPPQAAAQSSGQIPPAGQAQGAPGQPMQYSSPGQSAAVKPFTFQPIPHPGSLPPAPHAASTQPVQPGVQPGAYSGYPAALPPPPPDLVQMGLDSVAPMSPEQVRKFMEELFRRQMAARENFTNRPAPKPVTSVQTLDLSPGATPPVVRVAVGQGSVLSFSDAAGRPWEIVDNINFHGNAFDVKLIGPHLYTIALKEPAAANVTVVLKDLPRPIVITAVPAQNEVDYLVEFTVPRFIGGRPPAAALATAADPSAPNFNAEALLNYLYRTPPKDAIALQVNGVSNVMAWQSSPTTMVVRTDGLLILPAWLRRHVATDGMGVYEVPLSPIISIARGGQVVRATISGFVVNATTAKANAMSVNVSSGASK